MSDKPPPPHDQCPELAKVNKISAQGLPHHGYGVAVDEVWENEADGSLWVGNGEYGSRVNFCPFCGFKARTPIPVQP